MHEHDHDDLTFEVSICPHSGSTETRGTRGWYAGVAKEDGDILQDAMLQPGPFRAFCNLYHERYGVNFGVNFETL